MSSKSVYVGLIGCAALIRLAHTVTTETLAAPATCSCYCQEGCCFPARTGQFYPQHRDLMYRPKHSKLQLLALPFLKKDGHKSFCLRAEVSQSSPQPLVFRTPSVLGAFVLPLESGSSPDIKPLVLFISLFFSFPPLLHFSKFCYHRIKLFLATFLAWIWPRPIILKWLYYSWERS